MERLAREEGFSTAAARVLASRVREERINGGGVRGVVAPKLAQVTPPASLPDVDQAAERLLRAFAAGERIGLVCDHDMDGTASACILFDGITKIFGHPQDRVSLWVSHRLTEGYGLNDSLAKRILDSPQRPTLLITADCGSSDVQRIRNLAAHGIETIVTDHHGTGGETIPEAVAFVNPKRMDATGCDPTAAGCMVAWMLLAHTWTRSGKEDRDERQRLVGLLDYAAVGTIADCVDLGAPSNRAVVRYGLDRIYANRRPCWTVAKEWFRNVSSSVRSEHIAFQLAPRVASTGRLDSSAPGIRFLQSLNVDEARQWGNVLDEANKERKELQKRLLESAEIEAEAQCDVGFPVIVVALRDGHAGVQGLVASRIAEQVARPTIVCSPVPGSDGKWSGSARGAGFVDARGLLGSIAADLGQDRIPHWGGHEAAGGFGAWEGEDDSADELFTRILLSAKQHFSAHRLALDTGRKVLRYDDGIPPDAAELRDLALELEGMQPYGQGFETPSFLVTLHVAEAKAIGDGTHWVLTGTTEGGSAPVKALWFGAGKDLGERVRNAATVTAIAELSVNRWHENNPKPELRINEGKLS